MIENHSSALVGLQRADFEIIVDATYLTCSSLSGLEFRRCFLDTNLLEGVFIEPIGTLMVVLLYL